jgi:CSLREA domain-containing protein
MGFYRLVFVLLVSVIFCAHSVNLSSAAVFTVDSTADLVDTLPGNGSCSTLPGNGCTLRAAVQEANALGGANTINVPAGTYSLNLTGSDEDFSATGDLDATSNITLMGASKETTVIRGDGADRVFHILGADVTIMDVTIQNGSASTTPLDRFGGGILISTGSTLAVTDTIVSANEANNGGGIYNRGTLSLARTEVNGNNALNDGGGIFNMGDMTIEDSLVSSNNAITGGGGIMQSGDGLMTNTTISGNRSAGAGGIRNTGTAGVTLTLTNCTVADNDGGTAGGIVATQAVILENTIVANNAGGDCGGIFISHGNNLDSDNTCGLVDPDDLPGTDPLLGLLADNGGPTRTYALENGSPAIDAGDNTICPATDQRGEPRPEDGDGDGTAVCDMGAYETAATGGGVVNVPRGGSSGGGPCSIAAAGGASLPLHFFVPVLLGFRMFLRRYDRRK